MRKEKLENLVETGKFTAVKRGLKPGEKRQWPDQTMWNKRKAFKMTGNTGSHKMEKHNCKCYLTAECKLSNSPGGLAGGQWYWVSSHNSSR